MPSIASTPPWKGDTAPPPTVRAILVVDDMAIVRDRVCDLLTRHGYVAIAAESGEAALAVAQTGQPLALAVLDILMPEARIEGIEAARTLTYTYAIPCLVLTTVQEAGTRAAAMFAGALGYLVKDVATGDAAILAGVRAALAGEPIPDPLANLPIDDTEMVSIHQRRRFLDEAYAQLTPRQREVAQLAAQGLTNEEIGAQLHIEIATVNSHIGEVLGRLRLAGRRDLRPRVIYDSLRDSGG